MTQPGKPVTKRVTVRIPAELSDRVDRVRGLIPRDAFIRDVVERAVSALEQERKR
jgi:metal-responsive CopG/Arc/MetJ family transcriptional regulator